ncbi:MAG TPA: hypothetical protein VKI45_09955, partial [Allosphingosinicella sp.]|nr:hypothetical protein [Allosphingosinicella sp.]
MRQGLLTAAASLLLKGGAPAPAPPGAPDQPPAAAVEGMRLLDQGAYLRGIEKLEAAAAAAAGPFDVAYQMWSQARPMIGAYAPPPRLTPGGSPLSPESEAKLRRATVEEAVPAIAAAARGTSIVILNEAHHSPRDRAFALQVAEALRPLGYDLLAAEAIDNYAPTLGKLARDRFPRRDTGTYLKEPVFADFMRQALALGFVPLAYEQTGEQQKRGAPGIPGREQAEAENLAALIKAHPGHKLFIYVGFSHVTESAIDRDGAKIEWMAARLKKMTGLDPLTIEQTSVAEDSLIRGGREAWALVAPRLRRSSVLRADGQPLALGPYAGAVDLQVV